MPKVTNEYYQYGYVRAKMGEISSITNRLSEADRAFSSIQLDDIQNDLERIHSEIQTNLQAVNPTEANDLLRNYEAVSIIADRELLNRRLETERADEEASSTAVRRLELERPRTGAPGPSTGAIPRRKVILVPAESGPVTSRATDFITQLNAHLATEKAKRKKKKKKAAAGVFSFGDEFNEPQGPYAENASDNEAPLPAQLCSAAKPSPGFKPITFPSDDLRNKIQHRRDALEPRSNNETDRQSPRRYQEPERPRYTPLYEYRGQTSSVGSIRGSSYSAGSHNSVRSYQSSQQEPLDGPISGVVYPPRARCLPPGIVIGKKDPNIIGMSEYFVQEVNTHTCILCRGHHRLFNCTSFCRMGLQERWYFVLTHGVCLYCLYPGHSSLSCKTKGTCPLCLTRHNTKLCPQKDYNKPN